MPVLFNLFASHNALYDNIEYYNCLLSYLLQLNNTEQLGKKFWAGGPGWYYSIKKFSSYCVAFLFTNFLLKSARHTQRRIITFPAHTSLVISCINRFSIWNLSRVSQNYAHTIISESDSEAPPTVPLEFTFVLHTLRDLLFVYKCWLSWWFLFLLFLFATLLR